MRVPKLLIAIVIVAGLYAAGTPIYAKPGRCLLVVNGKTYISGKCDVDIQNGGSFQITENQKKGRKRGAYFAVVTVDGTGASGFWNGTDGASHAHDPLGDLKRDGACWKNSAARVCAWK